MKVSAWVSISKSSGLSSWMKREGNCRSKLPPREASPRVDQVEMLAGPRDGDIEEAAFFLQVFALFHAAEAGNIPSQSIMTKTASYSSPLA